MSRSLVVLLCAIVLCLGTARADVLELQDGRVLHGKVTETSSGVSIDTPGGMLTYQRSMVKSIRKDDAPPPSPAPVASPAPSPSASPVASPAPTAAGERARREFQAIVDKLKTTAAPDAKFAADVWQAYIKEFANDPMAELARKELVLWQERAIKDLMPFGPKWLPRAEVEGRINKAKELLGKADAEADAKLALTLYKQAAEQNPHLIDIPMHKARRFQDDADRRNYGLALGEVLAIDPCHWIAANNLGVSAALDKNWAQGFQSLAKAMMISGNDKTLANMLQVAYLREYAEEETWSVVREGWHDYAEYHFERYAEPEWKDIVRTGMALLAAHNDPTLRQMIDKIHEQKKHVDEEFWGGKWIPAKDWKDLQDNNQPEFKAINLAARNIKAINRRGNIRDETLDDRKAMYDRILQLRVPSRPGELAMLDESGAEARTFSTDEGVKRSGYPRIWTADPVPNRSVRRPGRISD